MSFNQEKIKKLYSDILSDIEIIKMSKLHCINNIYSNNEIEDSIYEKMKELLIYLKNNNEIDLFNDKNIIYISFNIIKNLNETELINKDYKYMSLYNDYILFMLQSLNSNGLIIKSYIFRDINTLLDVKRKIVLFNKIDYDILKNILMDFCNTTEDQEVIKFIFNQFMTE